MRSFRLIWLFQVDRGFNTEVVIRVIFMRKKGIVIVPELIYISDLAYMTAVEVQMVVRDDLINAFLCKLVYFSGLGL